MTVRLDSQGVIVLEGICPSEDAETLLQKLTSTPAARIDLRGCEFAHSAVIQVLMAAKPKLLGPPAGSVLREWLYSILHLTPTD
jgi:hypothetical protein